LLLGWTTTEPSPQLYPLSTTTAKIIDAAAASKNISPYTFCMVVFVRSVLTSSQQHSNRRSVPNSQFEIYHVLKVSTRMKNIISVCPFPRVDLSCTNQPNFTMKGSNVPLSTSCCNSGHNAQGKDIVTIQSTRQATTTSTTDAELYIVATPDQSANPFSPHAL
jgi:hypothetical protein